MHLLVSWKYGKTTAVIRRNNGWQSAIFKCCYFFVHQCFVRLGLFQNKHENSLSFAHSLYLKYRIIAIVIIKLLHLTYFFLPTTVSFMAVTSYGYSGNKTCNSFIRLVKQCLILPFLLRICMSYWTFSAT